MANGLYEALLALPMRPVDTVYGQLSNNVVQNIPNLINPYGSNWEAAGIGLGSVLTSALLGYQARKEAQQENSLMQPLLTQALQAKSPEAIDAILSQPGAGRMTDLGTQLKLSILQNQAAAEAKKGEFLQALQLKAMDQDYMPKALEGLIAPESIGAFTPKDRKDLEMARQRAQIDEEAKNPARQAEQAARNNEKVNTIQNELRSDKLAQMFEQSRADLETAKQLAASDSATATLQLKKIAERIVNPSNMVTLQELKNYDQIQSIKNQLEGWFNQKGGLSNLDPETRKELVRVINIAVDSMGQAYNQKVNSRLYSAKKFGWTDDINLIAPFPLHMTSEQKAAADELARRKAARGN